MTISEQLEKLHITYPSLTQGSKARIRQTGQVVDLKRVSEHGISVVTFSTGGDYMISNRFLEPMYAEC